MGLQWKIGSSLFQFIFFHFDLSSFIWIIFCVSERMTSLTLFGTDAAHTCHLCSPLLPRAKAGGWDGGGTDPSKAAEGSPRVLNPLWDGARA